MSKRNKGSIKLVFFGTPIFAVTVLEKMSLAGITPTLIVTAPDKPQGRDLNVLPPPVEIWASEKGIESIQPQSLANDPTLPALLNTEWDLFVVASYGKLLPKSILALPRRGVLNVHPSLLPKLRGASPVRTAILTDAKDAVGATIMLMNEKMDEGPIVAQARIQLEEWPVGALLLEDLLAQEGGTLLSEVIPLWMNGEITPAPQNDNEATFSEKITKEMGRLDIIPNALPSGEKAREALLKIKALEGWPGAFFFTERGGKTIRVKITDASVDAEGKLKLISVIPEGKKEMNYDDFLRG